MATQTQGSAENLNKDVDHLLPNFKKEKNQQERGSTSRGRVKANRGRGSGGRTTAQQTRSVVKEVPTDNKENDQDVHRDKDDLPDIKYGSKKEESTYQESGRNGGEFENGEESNGGGDEDEHTIPLGKL
ncbi:uncharacterized protein MELLADRAFT_112965 [Melampsora larici-populina 98AG31]|uniref:Uncharacterized protein n=1 Tax=Melampsora larici-populina (strain 98AG31 / pathotype 3-4-7) TaxID=747676 RepID=F4S898_MELLP|nr:uncharacterized protein MELLADRAFT_112965 [Melampsora larici-populina 98AG31]EGF99147.1 hypothetical protein MELLADRAFT_112965 [Melampsora larici-populina 98AG31]